MPKITLTFDTDKDTISKIYDMLGAVKPSENVGAIRQGDSTGQPVDADAVVKASRQAAAANARAAKANKGAKAGPNTLVGMEELGGANGEDQAEGDDMGLVPPSMSPGEARDAGLALVREAYAAGHVKEVKELQREWNVAKFYDVPVEDGNKFYQRVMKLVQGVGLRQ